MNQENKAELHRLTWIVGRIQQFWREKYSVKRMFCEEAAVEKQLPYQ